MIWTDIHRIKRHDKENFTVLNQPYIFSNGYQSTPLLQILQIKAKQAIAVIVVSKLTLQRKMFLFLLFSLFSLTYCLGQAATRDLQFCLEFIILKLQLDQTIAI